jgi:hypothetical protein
MSLERRPVAQELHFRDSAGGQFWKLKLFSKTMKTHIPCSSFWALLALTPVCFSSVALSCLAEGDMKATSDASPSTRGVQYAVNYLVGGIDRVTLTKRDDARNVCFQVTLASPNPTDPGAPGGSVQLPPNWTVESAIMAPDANACGGMTRRRPSGAIAATEVTGSVRWGNSPTEGTAVDLRLSFSAQGGKPAFTEQLSFTR